jgi:hypothetical protein
MQQCSTHNVSTMLNFEMPEKKLPSFGKPNEGKIGRIRFKILLFLANYRTVRVKCDHFMAFIRH